MSDTPPPKPTSQRNLRCLMIRRENMMKEQVEKEATEGKACLTPWQETMCI